MKKIIFVLVILAVLLFSGCDAMLEVFYPEFADDFDGNNIVDIEYEISDYHHGVLDTSGEPLMMSIYNIGDGPGDTALATINFYDKAGWGTFFIDDGNYDIWIWCDVDGDTFLSDNDIITITEINVNFTGTDGYMYESKGQVDFTTYIAS